jgi:pimeloyl-ACP methyl ester carboxylesterase
MAAWVMPRTKTALNMDRFVIPYRVYGDGVHTLVFINGIQQSMAMWQSFVRRFCRDYRIVIFDFPYQGKGRIVSGSVDLTLDEQVDVLGAIVNAAGIDDRLTICSASWGGVIAAGYAVRHPHRVQRLILASMGTKPNKKMTELITQGTQVFPQDSAGVAEALIQSFGQDLPPAIKNKIVTQFQRMSGEALEAFCRHGLWVLSIGELGKAVDVSQIKCKTILLHGENDTIIDADDVRVLATQIPRAEMKVIKGVGHFLHLEKEDLLDVYDEILAAPY